VLEGISSRLESFIHYPYELRLLFQLPVAQFTETLRCKLLVLLKNKLSHFADNGFQLETSQQLLSLFASEIHIFSEFERRRFWAVLQKKQQIKQLVNDLPDYLAFLNLSLDKFSRIYRDELWSVVLPKLNGMIKTEADLLKITALPDDKLSPSKKNKIKKMFCEQNRLSMNYVDSVLTEENVSFFSEKNASLINRNIFSIARKHGHPSSFLSAVRALKQGDLLDSEKIEVIQQHADPKQIAHEMRILSETYKKKKEFCFFGAEKEKPLTVAWLMKKYKNHGGGFFAVSDIFGRDATYETAVEKMMRRWERQGKHQKGASYLTLSEIGRLPSPTFSIQ